MKTTSDEFIQSKEPAYCLAGCRSFLLRCLQLSAVIAPIRLIFIPARLEYRRNKKLWGAIYGSVLRPCVPLFVMITGALLLPVRGDASTFYKNVFPVSFIRSDMVGAL